MLPRLCLRTASKLFLCTLLGLAPTAFADTRVVVRQGDIDSDGLNDDLLIVETPELVLLHGDVVTPIVVEQSRVGTAVLQGSSSGTLEYLEDPTASQLSNARDWPESQVEVTSGLDLNGDTFADIYLANLGSVIPGHGDLMVFAESPSGGVPLTVSEVDSDLQKVMTEIYGWIADPDHFEDNAPVVPHTETVIRTYYYGVANSGPSLGQFFGQCETEHDGNCWWWFGHLDDLLTGETCLEFILRIGEDPDVFCVIGYHVFWDEEEEETTYVRDYSVFDPHSLDFRDQFGDSLAAGELIPQSVAAIAVETILSDILRVPIFDRVLSNAGTLPGDPAIDWVESFRLGRLLNLIYVVLNISGDQANNLPLPLYRIVDDAELAGIFSTVPASFKIIGSEMGVKQFWIDHGAADKFATKGLRALLGGTVPYHRTMVQTFTSLETRERGFPGNEPGIGTWIAFDATSLPFVNADAARYRIIVREQYPAE